MPVNSFEDYPMSWRPDRSHLSRPIYQGLADLLIADILSGHLKPHTKLPPQRELADFLDVNLSTVSKAFKICELRGFIHATVGSGTFVSPNADLSSSLMELRAYPDAIELGIIHPFDMLNHKVAESVKTLIQKPYADDFFDYINPYTDILTCQTAKSWFTYSRIRAEDDEILAASGAQNALSIILISLFKAGDRIATDPFTYPNFIGLANFLNIQLVPVANDEMGMMPEALDALCRLQDIQGVFLMPSCSNPTNITMPMVRRQALAEVIRRHGMLLIEDDPYAFLLSETDLPITGMVPELGLYISGTSKSICPGLRVAFIRFPRHLGERLRSGANHLNLRTPMLNIAIISEMLQNGCAQSIIQEKMSMAKRRNDLYHRFFPESTAWETRGSYFKWLRLNQPLSRETVENSATEQGLHVLHSSRFAVGRLDERAALRIAICSPPDEGTLEAGLERLHHMLKTLQGI